MPQAMPSANSATHVSWTKYFNIRLPSVLSLSTLTSNCWLRYNHETDPVLGTGLATEQDLDFSRQTSKRTLWTFMAKKRCRWPAIMLYAEFVLEQDSNKAQRLSCFFLQAHVALTAWAHVAIFSHHQYKYNLRHGPSSPVMAKVIKTNDVTPLLFQKVPKHRWFTHTSVRWGSTHAFVSEAYTRDGLVDSNFFLVIRFLDSWPSFTSAHVLMLPSNWCLSSCAHVLHVPLSHIMHAFEVPW